MNPSSLGPAEFGVSPQSGFLPEVDPLDRLPADFDAWEDAAHALPKLLMSDHLRRIVEALPPFPINQLGDQREWERAMVALSYIGHAYVWVGPKAATKLPAVLAVPWHQVATKLGRPPVLSYASYALHNWRRLDANGPIAVGNIALLQNFLAGEDEEWFILIHVDIEKRAAEALGQLSFRFKRAVLANNVPAAKAALKRMIAVAGRRESDDESAWSKRCDPYIYFSPSSPPHSRHGENHPDLPEWSIDLRVELTLTAVCRKRSAAKLAHRAGSFPRWMQCSA